MEFPQVQQGRSQGGFLGSEEPPPPQTEKGPPKGPLECTNALKGPLKCTKRSTIIQSASYYTDIDLDPVEDLKKFC